jgi:hypothetical protein
MSEAVRDDLGRSGGLRRCAWGRWLLPLVALAGGCVAWSGPAPTRRFPLPLPRNGQTRSTTQGPPAFYWNAWAAEAQARNRPLASVPPASAIYVSLDLALVDYASNLPGAVSQKLEQQLARSLAPWASAPSDEVKRFDVIVLPDQAHFEPTPQFTSLDVSPARLAAALSSRRPPPRDAWQALSRGESWFRFGTMRTPQPIMVGRQTGLGRVYLSIWDPEAGQPIEELVLAVCIGQRSVDCGEEKAVSVHYEGIAGDLQAAGDQPAPDAALQFLARGEEVIGVYRERGWRLRNSLVWRLQSGAGELQDYLHRTVPAQLNPPLPDRIRSVGRDLYEMLFPQGRADAARLALTRLLAGSDRPRLFVRLLRNNQSPPLTLPVGILSLPGEKGDAFLGRRARLEIPLERQMAGGPACVSAWQQVMPLGSGPVPGGPDPTIDAALHAVDGALLGRWHKRFGATDMDGFRHWLERPERTPAQGLLVISHQADGELYFSRNGPRLSLFGIGREFDPPAVAVLIACQTAGRDAARIVRNLNQRGVSGVVATSASIGPELAGRFLGCFWKALEQPGGQASEITAANALDEAVRCAGARPDRGPASDGFDPAALLFTYLGDPGARLCRVPTQAPLALTHGERP